MSAPNWARLAGQTISKNSTTILSATAVAGVVATAILTARATRRVEIVLQSDATPPGMVPPVIYGPEHSLEKYKAYTKLFWKDYIPPAVAGLATIACIVGANQIGLRRQAAMLGAYALVDGAFREYKDEVLNQIGETKERKVVDEIAARKIEENPPDNQVILVGGGEQLCYDELSGRYFHSDAETIRQAALNVNESVIKDMYASLNEFYGYLGLDSTVLGEQMGFNLDRLMDIVFTSHLAQGKTPCLAVTHKNLPVADYGKIS
jgi:hypothetical protein